VRDAMNLKRILMLPSGIYFGWRMVGVVTAVRVIGGGLHQYGFTVFFLPITRDLSLSLSLSVLTFYLSSACASLSALFFLVVRCPVVSGPSLAAYCLSPSVLLPFYF